MSFTFDDGPGTQTLALAEYLASEHIFAAFFMIGNRVKQHADTLRRLHALGHLVGNHTHDHLRLDRLLEQGQEPSDQILSADAAIRDIIGQPDMPILFRAPWGQWNESLAQCVADARFSRCIGPIHWDMPVKKHDWHFWGCQLPASSCAEALLKDIEAGGSGIVLLHDDSNEPMIASGNRVHDMMRLLVPALKSRGYKFLRLDAVPEIREAMQ